MQMCAVSPPQSCADKIRNANFLLRCPILELLGLGVTSGSNAPAPAIVVSFNDLRAHSFFTISTDCHLLDKRTTQSLRIGSYEQERETKARNSKCATARTG